jgi:hypothetical protein
VTDPADDNPSATIRSQHGTANLENCEFLDFASLSLAALEMTLQSAETLANGKYQPLPPLPFDPSTCSKSALTEAFTEVSPSTMLVNNDPLDPPAIEQSKCELREQTGRQLFFLCD